MKKLSLILLLLNFLFISKSAYCQDTIIEKNGTRINAKIIEIETDRVKYRKANYLNGPTINLPKSEIESIIYLNGDVETFDAGINNVNTKNPPSSETNKVITHEGYTLILNSKNSLNYALTIELSDSVQLKKGSQFQGFLHFIFQESRKNFEIIAYYNFEKTFSTDFKLSKQGSLKRFEKIRDYQLSKIEIPFTKQMVVIDINENDAKAINNLFSELIYVNELNKVLPVVQPDFLGKDISSLSDEELYRKGFADGDLYYSNYSAAGTGTLLTALLINGLFGLIPAIPTSLTPPKMKNLGYPSQELMNNPYYLKGYTDAAKKKKQRKVWMNWGIGTAISTVIIIIGLSAQ